MQINLQKVKDSLLNFLVDKMIFEFKSLQKQAYFIFLIQKND